MHRLVTFLGTGSPVAPHYESCRYRFGGIESSETRFVQRGIADVAKGAGQPLDEIVVLCTEKVRNQWPEALLKDEIAPSVRVVPVPDGRDSAELWKIFEAVRDGLGGSKPEPNLRLHLDVTHGFRVQPLIALAALDFVRSEWQRQRIDNLPIVRITYGAFEARDRNANVADLWDLSDLLTVGRWNSALTAVLAYGRGDELAALTKELGDQAAKTARDDRRPKDQGSARRVAGESLGRDVKAFSDDLCTGRLKPLFTSSAPALVKTLDSAEVLELFETMPALEGTLDWLRGRVSALHADSVVSTESGARATIAYARLCGDLQRFAEQAAALREGLVTLFAIQKPTKETLLDAGEPEMSEQRGRIDADYGRLGAALGKNKNDAEAHEEAGAALAVVAAGSAVHDLRNDVEHLGIRTSVTPAETVRKNLKRYQADVERLLERRFLNLSNHAVTGWPAAQREAALALDLGPAVDLEGGMPTVDPRADATVLRALAGAIADRAVAQLATGAHVATEHGLTLLLVAELQRRGVRCFTATTERDAAEESRPDGTVHRTHNFRFVQWREYARLA